MSQKMSGFWARVRPLIWEKAQQLFQESQIRTLGTDFHGTTATHKELREAGYFYQAKLLVLNNLSCQNRRLPTVKEEKILPLFKRDLLEKVMEGRKTQTRRTHKQQWHVGRTYGIRSTRFEKSRARITIIRRYSQRLGDVTEEEARKEGFRSLEEFKREWARIYGPWNPDQQVTAYEFHLVSTARKGKPSPAKQFQQP